MLMEKYHCLIPDIKLGKRSTKQFVKIAFGSIKNNGLIYNRILNWKFVVSCLNLEQISELQFNFLPRTVNDFFKTYSNYSDFFQTYSEYNDFILVVSFLKESVRNEIVVSNFNRAYNKPMTSYLSVINLDLVHLLPTEIKETWVETKLPTLDNPCDKARHIVHLPTTKSLPLLKELVKLQTDVDARVVILKCMFKTAIASNSQELIKDICLFVYNRFRNDKYVIRESLISELIKYKHFVELPEDCWEVIEQIMNINILENEMTRNINMNSVIEILKVRIHSRLLRDLPVESYFEKLLELPTNYSTFTVCKNTPFEKFCLQWFLNNLPEKKLNNTEKENDQRMEINSSWLETFLECLCQWNIGHSNDRIDFPEWLNDWITYIFTTECCVYRKLDVLELLKKDGILKYDYYRKVFPNFINPQILTYNLHQDPELILSHTEILMTKILSVCVNPYYTFLKQCRLYPALKLSDIIFSCCYKILTQKYEDSEKSKIDEKIHSIEVLSIVAETTKFVEVIKDFYPTGSVVDDYSDKGRELFQLQTEITRCLKYVNIPSEVLEALRKFAVGDYLKLVVGSLKTICLHTPENKILKLLKEWLDCPISLRKHFLRAYFKIAPVARTMEFTVSLFENEGNMSLRVLLFAHGLRLFQKEPSSETFMVLKAVTRQLTVSDDTSISNLFSIENVPDEFVSEYVQLLWDVINHNIENEVLLKDYRRKIIALIEPNILQLLSEEFGDLIKEVFLYNSLDLFVIEYLLHAKN
ncbi:uncharacterized protein [Halyomorpha halys]|uniref:uncharacterized protein n=1 Tax=Halyomorpha halys TaxID=286706 RepID=UPI000D0C83E6|nr:uncharacterized protein LOC106690651 [Halyomorpha halys]